MKTFLFYILRRRKIENNLPLQVLFKLILLQICIRLADISYFSEKCLFFIWQTCRTTMVVGLIFTARKKNLPYATALYDMQAFNERPTHLYKRLCPSVCRSVRQSVHHAFLKYRRNEDLRTIKHQETHRIACKFK